MDEKTIVYGLIGLILLILLISVGYRYFQYKSLNIGIPLPSEDDNNTIGGGTDEDIGDEEDYRYIELPQTLGGIEFIKLVARVKKLGETTTKLQIINNEPYTLGSNPDEYEEFKIFNFIDENKFTLKTKIDNISKGTSQESVTVNFDLSLPSNLYKESSRDVYTNASPIDSQRTTNPSPNSEGVNKYKNLN